MATIKSYTDPSQSKVLAEILPIESADMWYQHTGFSKPAYVDFPVVIRECISDKDLPCWSLAALLEATPKAIVMNKVEGNTKYIFSSSRIGTYTTADNPIDACYEMIIQLHKLNLL